MHTVREVTFILKVNFVQKKIKDEISSNKQFTIVDGVEYTMIHALFN